MLIQERHRLLTECLFILLKKGLSTIDDILMSAALAFEGISRYKYRIVLGKKGKPKEIDIHFLPDNFPHLAGFQHLTKTYSIGSSRFGASRSGASRDIFSKILSGKISSEMINEDKSFSSVLVRLEILAQIESILDSSATRYFEYNPKKFHKPSKLKADYLAKGILNDKRIALVFFEKDNNMYIAKSLFPLKENTDYSEGQTSYTTVKIEKTDIKQRNTQIIFELRQKQEAQ